MGLIQAPKPPVARSETFNKLSHNKSYIELWIKYIIIRDVTHTCPSCNVKPIVSSELYTNAMSFKWFLGRVQQTLYEKTETKKYYFSCGEMILVWSSTANTEIASFSAYLESNLKGLTQMIQASVALYTSLSSCPYSWLIYHQAIQLFFFFWRDKRTFSHLCCPLCPHRVVRSIRDRPDHYWV